MRFVSNQATVVALAVFGHVLAGCAVRPRPVPTPARDTEAPLVRVALPPAADHAPEIHSKGGLLIEVPGGSPRLLRGCPHLSFSVIDSTHLKMEAMLPDEEPAIRFAELYGGPADGPPPCPPAGAINRSVSAVAETPIRVRQWYRSEELLVNGHPYPGTLLVDIHESRPRVINETQLELYLRGVVPHEIGFLDADSHDAICAQAVVSRSFAMHRLERSADPLHATIMDQVYRPMDTWSDAANDAILETRGVVLSDGDAPALALFHSTCAGETERIEEIWVKQEEPIPYLSGVSDRDEQGLAYCAWSKFYGWTETWTSAELESTLRTWLAVEFPDRALVLTGDPGELSLEILGRTGAGRVAEARLLAWDQEFILRGERIRWVLRRPGTSQLLRSALIQAFTLRDGDLTIQGAGWGHGLGMCQVGAIERARRGADWRQILAWYYPDVELIRQY